MYPPFLTPIRTCQPGWLIVVCLLMASWVHAELNFPRVVLDEVFVAYERDVGDVDGDGLNDVIAVSDGGTQVEWFHAPAWNRQTLVTLTGTYRYTRADDFKVADIDGDDDADLVVRLGAGPTDDGEGRAAWIENLGSGTGWVVRIIGVSPTYGKDIAVADLDRDGRLDIAYREDSLTQIWFNETNGWTEVALNHVSHEGMELGDVDMDGDPDVVLNGFVYLTPNTPAACRVMSNYVYQSIDNQWFTQSGDWTANSCKVSVGDVDGDGTNDVVFSQSERAGYTVTWYKKQGASWTAHPVAGIDYCHTLQAYDADLDGDTDLLVGGMTQSIHKGLRLLLNDGTGNIWTTWIIQTDGSYSAELGDIDNDDDLDIVGVVNWSTAPSYIYRSNAGGAASLDFWKYIRVSDNHVRTFGLDFSDVDQDGDEDIVSGPYLYRNPGGSLTNAWTRTTINASIHVFLSADVDGDDRADVLALQDNPGQNRIDLFWYEAQDALAGSWTSVVRFGDVPRSEHAEGFQGSQLASIEVGGLPEVVISSFQGIYYFSIPANPQTGTWVRVFITANDSDEGISVSDIDEDGHSDVSFTSGNSKDVKWARNPGNGNANWSVSTIGNFPEADWPDRCEVLDVDGDSLLDIVVTEENSGVSPDARCYWWKQPSAGPTNANWTRQLITTRFTLNSMDAGDVDKDGDMDLVLAEHRGLKRISIFANAGAGSFTEFSVGQDNENHLGGQLVDLDGDGDLDLAGIAYDEFNELHVWRNDSPAGIPSVACPTINPNGGVFDSPVSVSLFCSTPGAEIWYTLDGGDPSNQAPSVQFTNSFIIAMSTVVKARGFKTDFVQSPLATVTFIGPQVQTPVISPPGGTIATSIIVSISCATTGATIRYTLDGTSPSESSPVYSSPLTLTNTVTLRARVYKGGITPSVEQMAVFTLFQVGAVARWLFDERFGSITYDSSGSGRHGALSGATRGNGYHNWALQFDGIDDRVEVGTWSVAGDELTLCAWIKPLSPYSDNDARVISKATGITEQEHTWMLSLTTSGGDIRLRFRLKTGSSTTTLIAPAGNISLDEWQHAAATYDGAIMRLFLNGIEVGATAKSGDLAENSAALWVGANPPAAPAAFRGWIDDVRVYNVALTGEEINGVRNQVLTGISPDVASVDVSAGLVTLSVAADPGHYIILQEATNLMAAIWMNIRTQAVTDFGVVPMLHTSTYPHAVYRIQKD